jgi:hypothetical protein
MPATKRRETFCPIADCSENVRNDLFVERPIKRDLRRLIQPTAYFIVTSPVLSTVVLRPDIETLPM